jgi:hypothetical protein
MPKHRLTSRRTQAHLHHTVDMVDVRNSTTHLLTSAAAAGTNRTGRYFALCEADVVCADDLTDPGCHHYYWSCRSIIPPPTPHPAHPTSPDWERPVTPPSTGV